MGHEEVDPHNTYLYIHYNVAPKL